MTKNEIKSDTKIIIFDFFFWLMIFVKTNRKRVNPSKIAIVCQG